jgi:hypothetical protein
MGAYHGATELLFAFEIAAKVLVPDAYYNTLPDESGGKHSVEARPTIVKTCGVLYHETPNARDDRRGCRCVRRAPAFSRVRSIA